MIPKINSAHGSDTRNIINRAIEELNRLGIDVQTLVAEGQLTEQQYAELITVINGHLKSGEVDRDDLHANLKVEVDKIQNKIDKGEVSVHDIDINRGKLLPRHISEEVLRMISGDAPVNAIPADGSLTTEKYADNSVTPNKTSFAKQTKNLWDGEYYSWYITGPINNYSLVREFDGLSNGVVVMAPIKPGVSYTIKVHDEHLSNRFIAATSKEHPGNFIESFHLDTELVHSASTNEYSFENISGDNWLYIMVSNDNQKPRIQIEEGLESSEYINPHVFPKEYILPEIKDEIKGMQNTVTLIENITDGYPIRPNATSVIWIGPNEPIEIEPYDEWRETEGFTSYIDFNDYSNEKLNSDWVEYWQSGGTKEIVTDSTSPTGGSALRFAPPSNGYYALGWNLLEADTHRSDTEIFLIGKTNNSIDAQSLSVVIRGKSDDVGYIIGSRYNGNIRVSKLNGTISTLENATSNVDFLNYFNLLVRFNDGRIRVKCWQYGEDEPTDWLIDIEDYTIIDDGFIGVCSWRGGVSSFVASLGVGTGGMRAPRRSLF